MDHSLPIDGAAMAWPWALPFVGILLSIAIGPLLFPKIWHHHYGKITLGWAVITLTPLAIWFGPQAAAATLVKVMLGDYLSFILLLFALYTVAGGILISGRLPANAWVNTGLLTLGMMMASLVGTTGASLILVRPLIRANEGRRFNVHVIVFFILLAGNIAGGLSPLGDPPLFVGFLHGVGFSWPVRNSVAADTDHVSLRIDDVPGARPVALSPGSSVSPPTVGASTAARPHQFCFVRSDYCYDHYLGNLETRRFVRRLWHQDGVAEHVAGRHAGFDRGAVADAYA